MSSRPASLLFRPGPDTGCFIEDDAIILQGHIPWLHGAALHTLAEGETITPVPGGALLAGPDTLAGVLFHADCGLLGRATASLYARLLDLTEGWHLHRIWNFVPHINAEAGGLENYRAFNSGRLSSLQKRWGASLTRRLPAASALGTQGGSLALAFCAAREPAVHFENPLQESAIAYPAEYGLSPPAFARGSRCGQTWHLSGTASIRGCRTVGDDIATQLGVSLENIAALCAEMAVPPPRAAAWKIFLRHPQHLAAAAAAFSAAFPGDMASAMFLHADICRADLLVEIEGHLSA